MNTIFGTIWHHHPICELTYSYSDGYQRNFDTRRVWLESFLNRPQTSTIDVLKKLGYDTGLIWHRYPIAFCWFDWESGNEPEYHEIKLNGDWNEFYRLVEKRLEIAKATKDQEIESLYWPHVMAKK